MERIEFIRSPRKTAGLLILSIVLVAASLWTAVTVDDRFDQVFGWLGVIFFGAGVAIAFRNLVRGGVVFVFDNAGIHHLDNGIVIPWSEIRACVVISIRGTKFLGLTLNHPEQFLSRVSAAQQKLAKINERMGWGHWGIAFSAIAPGIDVALQFIRENAPAVEAPPG